MATTLFLPVVFPDYNVGLKDSISFTCGHAVFILVSPGGGATYYGGGRYAATGGGVVASNGQNSIRSARIGNILVGSHKNIDQASLQNSLDNLNSRLYSHKNTGAAFVSVVEISQSEYVAASSSALTHFVDSHCLCGVRFCADGPDSMRDRECGGQGSAGGDRGGSQPSGQARGAGAGGARLGTWWAGAADRCPCGRQSADGLALAAALRRGRRGWPAARQDAQARQAAGRCRDGGPGRRAEPKSFVWTAPAVTILDKLHRLDAATV
jgi:hypothetical protein